jgi:type I restriction enzyme M protein
MFFLKIFDDREKEFDLLRDNYKSPLPKHLRWSAWATDDEGVTGEALLDFVNNTLLPKLKSQTGGADKIAGLIRMTFEDANNYMKNGTLMRQVINKINGIDFNASDDRHMFGDIYEKLLKDLQSAGNAGEFYTPRAVTQFIVEQVNPNLKKRETILDPACGTGGFLVCAIEHLRKQARTEADEQYIQGCFSGIEKKHLPHVLCMTNLLLHDIDVPTNVRHDNTLARPLRDWSPKERVDVIVTNPPFGGMEEDGIESNYPAEFRTRETADLFLVLLMKILKPGGRAGLVLPDGTLFGEGVKTRIKEALLTECNLHTIVRLPNGVFNPYTGIRTNLLFFTKGAPTTQVWYYEHPYRRTVPHPGFTHLKRWGEAKRHGYSVFTSNVDGQFQRAGFDPLCINECHGSLNHLQCIEPCCEAIWSADEFAPDVDESSCLLCSALPRCPRCGGIARPNVLMFGDWEWIDARQREQSARLEDWLVRVSRPVVIELGAGKAIPSVRLFCERVISEFGGRLVRTNPRDADVPSQQDVGLEMGPLDGINALAAVLDGEE